jgi:hypothetical protein
MLKVQAVALVAAVAAVASAAPRRETLLLANCPRATGEYVGTLRARMVLARAFFDPAIGDDENIRAAALHQLRYVWGHYRNDATAHGAVQLVLSAEEPELTIVSRREAPYGRDLALPWTTTDPRLKIEDAYTLRAVAAGRVRKGDPAIVVEYQLRFKLALCGRGEDPGAALRVPLPPDPWLAYWYVPRARHRLLRYHKDTAITNPCADDDFADLPHPFYYWYDWLPTRHGPDDDGRAFDCRSWLRPGYDYDYVEIPVERFAAPSHDLSRVRDGLAATSGPLNATIVVGVTDHSVLDLGLDGWRAAIGDGDDLLGRATAARDRWAKEGPREGGTRSLLETLVGLAQVMTIESHASTVDDDNLRVEVRGRLKESGRALRVRLYLGMTDIFGPRPPKHWPILRRALNEDQLIIYWGHSGIGENFRLAQIEKNLNLSHEQFASELARSPARLIAFLSCYSYMYFGQDLLAAGAQHVGGGAYLFTGIEHARRENGPIAVLALVDRVLSVDGGGRLERLPMLGDDEFWLVKEVAGASR